MIFFNSRDRKTSFIEVEHPTEIKLVGSWEDVESGSGRKREGGESDGVEKEGGIRKSRSVRDTTGRVSKLFRP